MCWGFKGIRVHGVMLTHRRTKKKLKQRGATTRPQDAINALDVVLKEARARLCICVYVCVCAAVWVQPVPHINHHNTTDGLTD